MIKENNHSQNNIYLNKKNLTQMNNKSNLYFNIMNNKNNNFSTFLSNKVENKNNELNRNSNISINYSKPSINNYQDFSCNIYNFSNNIFPSQLSDCNRNIINHIQNKNNLYINNSNNDINNFSFYLSPNDLNYKLYLMQNKSNNLPADNINLFSNQKYANSNKKNIFDSTKKNISNNYNNNYNNYINKIEGINNHYGNINNINIYTKNNIVNNVNNISFDYSNNMINLPNQREEFIKYINSLPMQLVNFLCTPKGTLEIQKKLEKSNREYKLLLVNHLNKEGLSTIMKNTYGNYFFQQLIKNNEKSFISLIISYISEDFIDISKDFSGTFSLQALLDEISSIEEEQKILNCIKDYEIEMAFNKNATHVLQKIVLLFPDNHRIHLNEAILNNFLDLCLDSNGICLIKIFIKTNTLENNKKKINNIIINNFVTLAENPFGNYGIQYLMDIWNKDDLKDIKMKILEHIYKLSLQQFSSNVIEKAIEIFDEESRNKIIQKLCFEGNFILNLIKNKFGKYVLNKAIKYMKIEKKNEFEIFLINDINNNNYKNKDKNKINKLLIKLKNSKFNKNECFNNINKMYSNNFYYNGINTNINSINNYNNIVYNNNNVDYFFNKK